MPLKTELDFLSTRENHEKTGANPQPAYRMLIVLDILKLEKQFFAARLFREVVQSLKLGLTFMRLLKQIFFLGKAVDLIGLGKRF